MTTRIEESPPAGRRPRRTPSTPILLGVVIIALIAAGTVFLAVVITGQNSETQRANVVTDTAPAVLTLDVLCKRTDQLGSDLKAVGACGEKVDKAKTAVEGQPLPAVAAGLQRDDVVAIVQAQISGKVVTSEQVMRMIVDVYNANRPANGERGPGPTADQVLNSVREVCANDRCVGPRGADAPPATAAEILAQVSTYCAAPNDPCRGPQGERGTEGRQGVQGVQGQEGRPGPTCEPGYHVTDAMSGDIPPQQIRVCVLDAPAGG
jgi:hypothetical protein